MPLPVDGAVSGYAFRVGDRTITGAVMPKEVARERFEQAIVEGKTAALLEQERPDVFSQALGNVPPRATIVARITVDQRLAWLLEGQWELRFTVIGARYVSATDTREDPRAALLKVADGVSGRLHLELRVADALVPGARVESPSHALTQGDGGVYVLSTPEGTRLDRDLVVRWTVARPEVGVTLAVARPPAGQPHGGQAYGLCTVVPPSPDAGCESHPRDLIVLFDTSGSMGGEPIALAKRVIASVVDSLEERDRLELIEFSSRPHRYAAEPVSATPSEKKKAITWARTRTAGGGTEMHTAVLEALRALRPNAQRQVLLITDGYIGGEQRIVELCHERLPAGCRLHVVGVGAAANRTLSASLARAGRGAEILVGPGEDAERAARHLLERTVRPILTDVTITGDALVEHAPEHVPDVFAGAPLRAVLKLDPAGGELRIRGRLEGGIWEESVQVPPVARGEGNRLRFSAREFVADPRCGGRWPRGRADDATSSAPAWSSKSPPERRRGWRSRRVASNAGRSPTETSRRTSPLARRSRAWARGGLRRLRGQGYAGGPRMVTAAEPARSEVGFADGAAAARHAGPGAPRCRPPPALSPSRGAPPAKAKKAWPRRSSASAKEEVLIRAAQPAIAPEPAFTSESLPMNVREPEPPRPPRRRVFLWLVLLLVAALLAVFVAWVLRR